MLNFLKLKFKKQKVEAWKSKLTLSDIILCKFNVYFYSRTFNFSNYKLDLKGYLTKAPEP